MDIQLILMPKKELTKDFERQSKWMANQIKKRKEWAFTKKKNTLKLIYNISQSRRLENSLQSM